MPVRYPAPCRRTASRSVSVSPAGIWITDPMLNQAIESYQRTAFAPCRRLNTHTGPLESRRRMGKRHMTGLMQIPSTSLYPPLWHFEIASGAGMWQWEPPTTASDRRVKERRLSPAGMFNNFIGWLEKSDAAKPFLEPPNDDAATMVMTTSPEAAVSSFSQHQPAVSETVSSELVSSPALPQEITKLRMSIQELQQPENDALYRLAKTCRKSLRRLIERGQMSIDAMLLALEPLDMETRARIPTQSTADRIEAMIHRTVLSGINSAYMANRSLAPPTLWIAFTDKLCASEATNHDLHLFRRLMAVMPSSVRAQIPSESLFRFSYSFVTAQASRHNLFSHWAARAARFAEALQHFDTTQMNELDLAMREALQHQGTLSEAYRRMQFSWLMISANNAIITNTTFMSACREATANGLRLNSMQLWQLVTARMVSTGEIEIGSADSLLECEYNSMAQRWAALSESLLVARDAKGAIQRLRAIMASVGASSALADGLASSPLPQFRINIIRALATACDNHKFALQLWDAIVAKDKTGLKVRQWSWKSWAPFIERMIKDPAVDDGRVWQVLSLTRKDRLPRTPSKAAQEIRAKVQLLDSMATWYVEAAHRNDRQRLRRVQQCVSCQRSLTNGVSEQTLTTVLDIVTRDLEKGQWGRSARLEWVLGMVAESQGVDEAEKAVNALNGWRWVIDKANRNSS